MLNQSSFGAGLELLTRQSVPHVLETMFFATALPGMTNPCSEGCWKVVIAFRGLHSGAFAMCLDRGDARSLASALLARDPEEMTVDDEGLLACELANILCGSILSRAATGGIFELGAPQLAGALPPEADFRTGFLLDTGGALEVGFRFDTGERP